MQSIGLYAFAAAYAAAVALHSLEHWSWRYGAIACAVLLGSGCFATARYPRIARAALLAGAGVAVALSRLAFLAEEMPAAFAPLVGQKAEFTATVVELPDERETNDHLTLLVSQKSASMRVLASVPHYPKLHVGDTVRASGMLALPEPFETDGGRVFDYPDFLRKDGIFASLQSARVERIGTSGNPWLRFLRALEYIKEKFSKLVSDAMPEPESALAIGLIVGGKQGLGDRLIDAFTRAGMLQIVVLSGFNVMIVADAILAALAGLPRRLAFVLASTGIACFVLLAGAGSSALRAGAMALIAIYARATHRQYDVLRALIAALFLLGLWNPLMLVFDPGFQFSFVATLGLVLGTPMLEPRLLFLRSAFLVEAFSTTLAAELSLLPLLLWQTGNLSIVSVFANIAAMPVIPFCMGASAAAAFMAGIIGSVSPVLAALAGLPAYLGLAYVIRIADMSAQLPFATVIIPAFPFWMVAASYATLGYFSWLFYAKRPQRPASVP